KRMASVLVIDGVKRKTTSLRGLAAELLAQLAEEFIEHLLPRRLHKPRAHRRNQPADLALRVASHLAPLILRRDLDLRRPFHPARSALPLGLKRERLRRILLHDPDLSDAASLNASDAYLEMRGIAVFPRLLHLFAPVDALLEKRGIDECPEDLILRSL